MNENPKLLVGKLKIGSETYMTAGLVINDRVYIGCANSNIYVFRADTFAAFTTIKAPSEIKQII
jgi:hypothetical protein